MAMRIEAAHRRLPVAAGLILGFGLGMFFDGIVLHQLLQWHHMVSEYESTATVAGLELNTTWDGIFHLSAWVVTAVGSFLLWRSRRSGEGPSSMQPFIGLLLIGWGAFHAVDQIVFHLIVGAHHIRQVDDYQVYDWSFFAIGIGFAVVGWMLLRSRSASRSFES
jgi:uncharacterized membrane protein